MPPDATGSAGSSAGSSAPGGGTAVAQRPRRAARDHVRNPTRWDRAKRNWKRYHTDYLAFILLLAPNSILIAAFIYRPLILNIYYSTLNWTLGASTATSVGFGNYVEWFTDPHSWTVVKVTFLFTVVGVGGSMIIGLFLAIILDRKLHGVVFARSTIFAPYILSGVGVGLTWLFIFDPAYGALGAIIRYAGGASPDWYLSKGWALVMIMIVYVWKNLGYTAVIYLAGLQAIPPHLLEAADVDGASPGRKLWSVKLPLLSPTTMFLFITLLLQSFKAFDIIRIMTRGGPFSGTTTLMYQVYQEAFVNGRTGYSSTTAVIMFAILLVVTVIYINFVERKVTYQ